MRVEGHCDDRFSRVREVFEENFSVRDDVGACFAATLEGEFVIDLWAGHQDAERTRSWQEDTIITVYSTTKTMTFLCALILADRGLLDFDAPVSSYWPEFAANGKEGVRVKHVMSHSSGLPAFSRPFKTEELYDWERVCADLAAQAPWWKPGSQIGYHAVTQGYLIGEIVRRITGKTLGTFFREEVADRVGADFHIGLDPKDFGRVADLIPPEEQAAASEMDPNSMTARVVGCVSDFSPLGTRTEGWKRAEVPAINGHGNARSVVRAQTAMANGGSAFGVELLSEAGCRKALELQIDGMDAVFMTPLRLAMGYALPNETFPMSPNANSLWWGGIGGSTMVADTDVHLCFSYIMNKMSNSPVGNPRADALGHAIYESMAAL